MLAKGLDEITRNRFVGSLDEKREFARRREYYSFTTQFVIGFGLAFELPVVVLLLVKLGIVNYETLRRTRAFAVIIIFVVAAIITPTSDILTLVLMGGPMYVLYEICIGIAWLMNRRSAGE